MGLRVAVLGQATLADATRTCVERHFDLVPVFGYPDVVWFCYDTPILDDVPDPDWVMGQIRAWMPNISTHVFMLVSSQMPVGTIAALEKEFPLYTWAYSPENIRVKTAVEDFQHQARVVVGCRKPVPSIIA